MPICAFEAPLTTPNVKVNGVTGGLVLAKSGTQNNSTACDFVLLTNAEYDQIYHSVLAGTSVTPTPQNWLELGNMSVADAQSTSVYIGLLWAMVWGFKQIARSLINRERDVDE
jgi:hypothetical protein